MMLRTCPYCGKELERGELRSRGGNYFLPECEVPPSLHSKKEMDKRRAVMLPPDPLAFGMPKWPNANLCRNCKLILIPYE